MKSDYHVHTEFSDDSSTPMEKQIEKAIKLDLDEICFTDHVDYGVKKDWDEPGYMYSMNVNYPEYFKKLEIMKKKYDKKITIRQGLEFGVQCHTIKRYEKLYEKYRDKFDFILLSIHQINNEDFWSQEFQTGKTQDEYNQKYYEELLRIVCNFHDYSVLAHLDLMSRYDRKGVYPFKKIKNIVTEILIQAIKNNKGIELNTSSWRYGLKDTQPCREILKLYHDLGGKIITVGSDAHSPDYICAHFQEAFSILKNEIGFTEFCTFNKMEPIFHKIQ